MSTPIAFRATAAKPCPVCGTGTKSCSVTEDGMHMCRGEPLAGWTRITKVVDGAGFHHYRQAEDVRGRGSNTKSIGAPVPPRSWRADAERYARDLTDERRQQLATVLGLPVSCLGALPLIGFMHDPHRGECWTFPESDAAGTVTAICRRIVSPKPGDPPKPVMSGGSRGVYVSSGWRDGPGPILVPEGASDVLALATVGLTAIGRPNDKGGAEIIAAMLRADPREVIGVGENDKKENGHWPGREGAEHVAKKLAALLQRPVKWALPPDGVKDSRVWVCNLAKLAGKACDWSAIGRVVFNHLTTNAQVINVPLAIHQPDDEGESELVFSSLKGIEPKAVRFLVPGYVPCGMMGMIAGEGGHGKSMATLELAAALSVGRCAFGLDYPAPQKGKTLLISCEDDWERTIVPRLAALGADFTNVLRVEGVRMKKGGKALDFHMGHFRELERALVANPDIKLIVIDPAGAYIGRAGVNDNHDADLRAVLGPLSEAANRTGATVLLIKHLNKSAGVSAVQRVGGSAGYINAVRFAYMVAPDPDDADKKLMLAIKANVLPSRKVGLAYRLKALPTEEAKAVLLREWPTMRAAQVDELADQLFRQEWEGSVEVDANEIAGGRAKRAEKKEDIELCNAFIRKFLGQWAWPDKEVEEAVVKAGFSFSLLGRTKTAMRAGVSKTDPNRLSSKAKGEGGAWWNWIGSQYERPADRPSSSSLSVNETEETERLRRLRRLKTEDSADGAACDDAHHKQSVQSTSLLSLSEEYPPAASQGDCPATGISEAI